MVMKLIIAIVKASDGEAVTSQLMADNYRVTRIASTGGFLHRRNVTLLIGVEPDSLQGAIDLLQQVCCPPEEPGQNRATLFVLNASYFQQI
jgi:uncharacterized protein YaaQ